MAFHRHQKHKRTNPTPWIKIGVSRRESGHMRATISLSGVVCEHLGIQVAQQVDFGIGSGSDEGWMEIRKSTDGEGYTLCARGVRDGVLQWNVTAGAVGANKFHETVKISSDGMRLIMTEDGDTPVVRVELPATLKEE